MASLVEIDNLSNTEHITKLFPKCRPRDINLNSVPDNEPYVMDTKQRTNRECEEGESGREESSTEESNGEEQGSQDNKVVLQLSSTKPSTYKLRDSRIIEIAGGREVFSQSRCKAIRKSRSDDKMSSRKHKNDSNAVWEIRSRNTDPKRNQSSREVTETVFSTEVHSLRHQRMSQQKTKDGGSVVFDDIEETWPCEPASDSSPSPSRNCHPGPPAHYFKVATSVSDGESLSPEYDINGKTQRVIGGLPIADYEGSPRRYGPKQPPSAVTLLSSPSFYAPRPGFPQRVFNDSEPRSRSCSRSPSRSSSPQNTHAVNHPQYDYMYEFSETRKVLEEFFKSGEKAPHFQDLEYELRRRGSSGNAYVGLRLAKATEDEQSFSSPPKPEGKDLLTLQEPGSISGSTEDLETEVGHTVGHSRNFTLSPETTDCDSNCDSEGSSLLLAEVTTATLPPPRSMPVLEDGLSSGHASDTENNNPTVLLMKRQISEIEREIIERNVKQQPNSTSSITETPEDKPSSPRPMTPDIDLHALDPLNGSTPPPPAPQSPTAAVVSLGDPTVEAALKDIRLTLQRTKALPIRSPPHEPTQQPVETSPIWIPRRRGTGSGVMHSGDEDEADTDLETDRLLGQQRTEDPNFFDDKMGWRKGKKRNSKSSPSPTQSHDSPPEASPKSPDNSPPEDSSTNLKLNKKEKDNTKKKGRNKEVMIHEPAVLIEGVLFRARYLGSTQLVCEGQPTKSTRMMQAEEAVSRIKALAPEGETQPSTEVDLFISTEKIMVLNTDLKEIMMDHALRTISYIADIGDLVVLMARRRFIPHEVDEPPKINRTPKMICHVFESEEAQFIAQSIGQAFQVAYMEFLKANGIEDHSFVKEMDYQEVLNSQEIFGDELQMFAKKEMQKEVVVPKAKGEILGVVIVESGWGSMLPTVVIANLAPAGAAARCGQLNIGDQIIAINGVSLVGLPLSTCQNYIKNSKTQTVVKLTVVPCAPVVEVKIKRPDTKYQLGFSVQNGVICSLLRGGIAERGGVRVGHRIIEINNQSVVAVPHEKIVNLLATSVGEILMKTMPTSMFRLLTGQETPVYI
ncbi:uncharacterized protein LOC106671833 isoform X2 [Cimex lectularius]|uniref:Protein lin-10 n=1 Tax=Cimex lectularius TaxID=79782 RepID=A0A8I6SR09_CIMLE|nr:uncharacterized protein LOC106671833 isoform X2 [Cimex lectularius]